MEEEGRAAAGEAQLTLDIERMDDVPSMEEWIRELVSRQALAVAKRSGLRTCPAEASWPRLSGPLSPRDRGFY